jgi:hypothetical protein
MMDLFALILSGVAGGVVMLMHCTFVNESRAARTREVLNQNEWLEHELKAEKEISLRDRLARADAEYERDEAIHRLHQYGLWEGEIKQTKMMTPIIFATAASEEVWKWVEHCAVALGVVATAIAIKKSQKKERRKIEPDPLRVRKFEPKALDSDCRARHAAALERIEAIDAGEHGGA